MDEHAETTDRRLTLQEISDAITGLGWRLILGAARTSVRVGSLAHAAGVAERVVTAVGDDADDCLQADVRRDRVLLTLQSRAGTRVSTHEIELAGRISAVVGELGLSTEAEVGGGAGGGAHSVQGLEIGIDTMDMAAIRPFWKAVLGYCDEAGAGTQNGIVDPLGQGPAVWFQQMDESRPQRNRIHFDVSVPHDEAEARIKAALAAGGTLGYAAEAPAFWVLADAEGNEACVTTWQGRD
jgi:4a-hydroxytetrahydrobiopterin dehydratase